MRSTYRKGWLSAGRLFRLIQMMRLYETDSPNELAAQLIELTGWSGGETTNLLDGIHTGQVR